MNVFLTVIVSLIAFPAIVFAETAYVHSLKTTVYSSPSMSAKQITTLSKGDSVTITGEKGSWYQTTTPKGKGWVYKFTLKKQPVASSDKLYSKLRSFFYKIESISGKSRRRPSSYSTTAAARGLRDKRRHFAGNYTEDYEALKTIESIDISDDEALLFLKQGVDHESP